MTRKLIPGRLVIAEAYRNASLDGQAASGTVTGLAPGRHSLEFSYSPQRRTKSTGPNINARTP